MQKSHVVQSETNKAHIETIEKEYELVSNNPLRKGSLLEKELPNDF